MLKTFVPYSPHTATRQVIEQANEIIEEYAAQGFTLTLRQLYYQFVARDLIANLIRAEIEPMIDMTKWRRAKACEEHGRKQLQAVAKNWRPRLIPK